MNVFLPDYLTTGESSPAIAPLTAREALSLLGYSDHQMSVEFIRDIRDEFLPYEATRIANIAAELSGIDASIKEVLADSAVVKTCKTELNWVQQLRLYRGQGHELLKELARLYDVPLAYSKYGGGHRGVTIQYQ